MDYSFHNSFSLMSLSDHPTTQFSLPPTMSSFTSLDTDPSHHHEPIGKPAYEPSTVLLFKGIPEDTTEMEILTLCRPFGSIKDILIARHKRYVFVEFSTSEQAINCYKAFTKFAPSLKGYPLYVFYTGKGKINKPDSLLGPPSRFLLVIFNKETQRIDANLVFQLLFPYGKCLRIMTFQTKPVQAFIEMEDVTQAIMAKEDLDGKNLTVLYSEEKDFFKEQGQNLEGPPPMIPFFQHQSYSMSELHVQEKQNQIEDTSDRGLARLASMEQVNKNMSILGPLLHAKEEKATNILIVKNLPKNASARLLFRLFGVCGNVMKVKIFFKNPENALVEYQDSYQASLAKFYLNNCPLNGNNIFIANSKQGVYIDTSMLKKGEETQYMGDYTASTEHRYKFAGSKNHSNIAQPSKVLHLSNLCDDKDEMYYRDLFKKYGTVKKLIFLKGGDKMALVEMENVGDAVNVLVNLHNYNINGKFLKVSFSKYSKIREFK